MITLNNHNAESFFAATQAAIPNKVLVYHKETRKFEAVELKEYNAYVQNQLTVINEKGLQTTPIRLAADLSKAPADRLESTQRCASYLLPESQQRLKGEIARRNPLDTQTQSFLSAMDALHQHNRSAGQFSTKKVVIYNSKDQQFKAIPSPFWGTYAPSETLVVTPNGIRVSHINLKLDFSTLPDTKLANLLYYSTCLSKTDQDAIWDELNKRIDLSTITRQPDSMIVYNTDEKAWKVIPSSDKGLADLVAYDPEFPDLSKIHKDNHLISMILFRFLLGLLCLSLMLLMI